MSLMYILIVYDIRDDKRRLKIDKELSTYGDRVNFSVFELRIKSEARLVLLKDALRSFIDSKVDSIRLYHFDRSTVLKAEELGSGREPFVVESSYVF